MGVPVVLTPGAPALGLARVKRHVSVEHSDHDTRLVELIAVAQAHIENTLNRTLTTASLEQRFEPGPLHHSKLYLGRGPVRSIVEVVASADGAETPISSSSYSLSGSEAIYFGYGAPTVNGEMVVRYTAGYGTPAQVPEPIKHAMLLLVAHYYANPDPVNIGNITTELPFGVDNLLAQYKDWRA